MWPKHETADQLCPLILKNKERGALAPCPLYTFVYLDRGYFIIKHIEVKQGNRE